MNKKYIAVYGSLRNNEYNFYRFENYFPNQIKFIKSSIIQGYDLYSLGSYPCIYKSQNSNKKLVVDILECSEECFNAITNMELGANYHEEKILLDNYECTFYVYNREPNDKYSTLIEHGDWSKRNLNKLKYA